MSLIATQVHYILEELFPPNPFKQVFCEHYVNFRAQKLFFDFFIKKLDVLIEVQGQQHSKFVKHFHNSREDFLKQRERDNLKIEYIQENNFYLAYINYNESVTGGLLADRIHEAMTNETSYAGKI